LVRSAYLGLGSNVGDRSANLRAALEQLRSVSGVRVLRTSSVYETEPVGERVEQRDFHNAAVEVETTLDPRALLAECKRIELELGREPGGPRHGARPIDVDLLLVGDLMTADEQLVLPHPELTRRRFVLTPLLELDPDLALPNGQPLAGALAALGPGQRVNRVASLSEAREGSKP
jgi:2-amino-4-hydroxy-6-hydroxymethyldihydropteridine diphosphokinase